MRTNTHDVKEEDLSCETKWLTQTARKQVGKTMAFFTRRPIWSPGFKLPCTVAIRVTGL